ncbi:hypothetical protein [Shinella kummerowiae]|uniref:hypothetical protein n=1 Tax=Shinella kummerowiae TaxID=417745 RepID=UPI0021B579B3|nr:hypothetical protein [Shinella kummerowiae]MCT7662338.1 hypothetical protein [Shinella kummerowiae]
MQVEGEHVPAPLRNRLGGVLVKGALTDIVVRETFYTREFGGCALWDFVPVAVGAIFAIAAFVAVFCGREVSVGHSIVLGAAIALTALPYAANVEWTDGGFKFVAKAQNVELATKLEDIAKAQVRDAQSIRELAAQVSAIAERINSPSPEQKPLDLGDLSKLKSDTESAIASHQKTVDSILKLKNWIEQPVMQVPYRKLPDLSQ